MPMGLLTSLNPSSASLYASFTAAGTSQGRQDSSRSEPVWTTPEKLMDPVVVSLGHGHLEFSVRRPEVSK